MFSRSSMLCLALIAFSACSEVATDGGDPARGPIGKADLTGSCDLASCGDAAPVGNCYCDDLCVVYEDCCENYDAVCNAEDDIDEPIFCGGIAGVACPSGLTCELDGPTPDAGGHCVLSD